MHVETEKFDGEHHGSDHDKKNSANESSSSDSDSDSDEEVRPGGPSGHTVLPSIADELNHAECIKDLSFFKLNWEDRDLETFHRPNIQRQFEDGKDKISM